MFNLNRHTIIGRVTKEVDFQYVGVQKDKPMAKFSVAVNRFQRKDAPPDERPQTDFFDVTAFGKDAEYAAAHFVKGSLVYVEGPNQTDTREARTEGERPMRFTQIVVGGPGATLSLWKPDQ